MENKTNWWMIIAIISLVLLVFGGSGMMGFGGFGCGDYGYGNNYGYGGMMSGVFGNPLGAIFGFFGMIVLWGFAIFIIIYFIKIITDSL